MRGRDRLRSGVMVATGLNVVAIHPLPPKVMAIEHAIVELSNGSRAFAKIGGGETQAFQDAEMPVYGSVTGSFLPRFIGVAREDSHTTLVLEDLSGAVWPPPWTPDIVGEAVAALRQVHQATLPAQLPRATNADLSRYPSWMDALSAASRVETSLNLPPGWLTACVPHLSEVAAAAKVEGTALVHGDAHGGNFCLSGARGVWVDWSSAHQGDPDEDFALLATSIAADGGPTLVLSDNAIAITALNAGSWAARAGLPPPTWGPEIRAIERHLLRGALRLLAPILGTDASA